MALGFTKEQAEAALGQYEGQANDTELAINYLLDN
jgi:hypothetical protein